METTQSNALDFEEDSASRGRSSIFGRFWRRFARNRLALAGVAILLLIVLMALFAPFITRGYDPNNEAFAFKTPFLLDPHTAPTLSYFPLRIFGTTGLADYRRPVFAEVLFGARPTLIIGVVSAAFAAIIGTLLGAISGYFGGWIDAAIMRVADLVLALPFMPLVIALIIASTLTAQNVQQLVIIFSLVGWAAIARLVRAQFLVLREQGFAEAARAAGIGNLRIIMRHLLPNAVAPIVVAATLNVAGFILAETTMEYLQVINLGTFTWGSIIAVGYQNLLLGYWWWTFFPGLFLTLTVLSINYIGEGLRDALDVQERLF